MNNSEFALEKQGGVIATPSADMLEAALAYAARGWSVVPCHPDTKRPLLPCDKDANGNKIIGTGGLKKASKDPAQLREWWVRWPQAMIGVRTGRESGVWVLDIDDEVAFAGVEAELCLPSTLTAISGGKRGRHMYFACTDDDAVPNTQGIYPGADTRGDEGYIIVPPSVRADGKRYEWVKDEEPSEAPGDVLAAVRAKGNQREAAPSDPRYTARTGSRTPITVAELGFPETVDSEAARLALIVTPKGSRGSDGQIIDRDAVVKHFIAEAVREGWFDDEIFGVLLHPENPIAAKPLERQDCLDYIGKNIAHYRRDEGIAEGEVDHICDRPKVIVNWGRLVANCLAKQRVGAPPNPANDASIGIVRSAISATPYTWRNPSDIPQRPWVFGNWLLRNTVTGVVAPGGVGKSSLWATAALSLATGRALLNKQVCGGPKRVWLWNLEDDYDELDRQIAATALNHDVTPDEAAGRLFVDSGPDGSHLCIAHESRDGLVINEPVINELLSELKRRQIDVLVIDPFVSSHQIDENDNGKIDTVAKKWAYLAKQAHCSIVLVHHSRKLNGTRVTADASRGASALGNACRSVLTLNRMEPSEAKSYGIRERDATSYFTVENDKSNRAKAGQKDWFHIASVSLGNGGFSGGDSVGAVEPWSPPNAFEGITNGDLAEVQRRVAEGCWRESDQSPDWVGNVVAGVLALNPQEAADKATVKQLTKTWIASGSLKIVKRKDAKSKLRNFVEVGALVENPGPRSKPGA
ncbi:bifunctional DNA primase/polymerase [Sphingomonas lacusdianchii]|uniref:bifunctional DNA primase/polymerase n=1 Tax=Sphingomonas lacusdianchii TaxID=2917992 RepID=UPI001F5AC0A2|nr:bifunctional DNA primase/polymerase [Sphingomonas sp. JXJ CY 53]